MKRTYFFLLLFSAWGVLRAFGQDYKDEKYVDIEVQGWKVKVNTRLISGDTSILKRSLGLFGKELYDIGNTLPPKAVEHLKRVVIWFELSSPHNTYTGMYLSSEDRLERAGINPEKAKSIEIIAPQYIDARTTYGEHWVILHELAHAYHDRVIGFGNQQVKDVFKTIRAAGLYRRVRRGFNTRHHGYALSNYREYFAEISTAYFGHIDYYPNDRADLRHYDPLGYKLVEDLWEVQSK